MTFSSLKMESMHFLKEKARGMQREGLSNLKLFVNSRSGKREVLEDSSSSNSTPSPDVRSVEKPEDDADVHPGFGNKLVDIEDPCKWTVVQTQGTKPAPRFNHAATVVGRKLLVIGGESGSETQNDVQMLHLGKLSWCKLGVGASAPVKGLPVKTGPVQKLPNCKGHSLITWGKTVLLIGGQMDPPASKVTVWSFDLEMDCWTTVVTKGEIPTARSGQSVTRAGSILIMFGGEDVKGRKLNDLHILDLKSLMWLPLHPSGKGPSPRARHIAAMYDDRFLLIFGGETKSKTSNDIYGLDFDNMEWSKLKTKGLPPAPRAGHAGALVGDKWYIAGGESRIPGRLETSVLDILRMEWSTVAPAASLNSSSSLQGLSLIFVQRKGKRFLVAFGGCGIQASNSVQVLHIPSEEQSPPRTLGGLLGVPITPDSRDSRVSTPDGRLTRAHHGPYPSLMGSSLPCACVGVAKTNLVSIIEHRSLSGRSTARSVSDFSSDLDIDSGLIPLRKRYALAQQSLRMDPAASRASIPVGSSADMLSRSSVSCSSRDSMLPTRRRDLELPKLKDVPLPGVAGIEGSERLHQSAQSIRGDLQSTAPSVDSGLLCAEDLQITAPSVRPGLVSSVGDAGTLFCQSDASFPGRARSHKGSSQSSEFSGYAETFVSGVSEERIADQSLAISTSSSVESNSNTSWALTGWQSSTSTSNRTTPDYEEDELTVLSKLHKADSAEERSVALSSLRRHHERKLGAAIRKGELLAGQLVELRRSKEEAERIRQTLIQSRQQTERRLAVALKQTKDLQDKMVDMVQVREESNNLIHSIRVENLKLEHDLALKTAVLEDVQMELQAVRGLATAEQTRAFELQMELLQVKQKLQVSDTRGMLACVHQPILA